MLPFRLKSAVGYSVVTDLSLCTKKKKKENKIVLHSIQCPINLNTNSFSVR
jgi:hypothetical protein